MATKKSGATKNGKAAAQKTISRSDIIAEQPITNGHQFAQLMSALMADVITGAKTPDVVNASCNAGGKLLKIVEMQLKYGKGSPLSLTGQAR
jgi:hypothetical protein